MNELVNVQHTQDYQSDFQNYKAKKAFLHSKEHLNWMEIAFQKMLQFSENTWGPIGYILNKKKPPILNHSTKWKYTNMIMSMLQYRQGGTFHPPEQIAEDHESAKGKDFNKGKDSDEERDEPAWNCCHVAD